MERGHNTQSMFDLEPVVLKTKPIICGARTWKKLKSECSQS